MKHLILTLFFIMVGNTLLAYDAEIDGIYYNLSGDEAEVTYKTENAEDNYAGDVVIPESVTYMDKEYRVTSIGRKAFFYCKDKVFVTIPKSVNVIGFLAFGGCSGLTSIIIPEGVKSLGQAAFGACDNLVSIDLPESLTSLDSETFYGCKSLVSINIPEGVKRINGDTFLGCSSLSSVTLSESVKFIGTGAFMSCTSLTKIIIPDGVEGIHERVFEGCKNLKSITLSKNLAHLGQDAFYKCSNLTEIICKAQNPPATRYIDKVAIDRPGGVFYGVDKQDCKLYVPKGCEEAYRASDLWKDFNIVEMEMGISEMKNERVKSEDYGDATYDLSGRKVNSQFSTFNSQFRKKGLYIQNGKKVAVK